MGVDKISSSSPGIPSNKVEAEGVSKGKKKETPSTFDKVMENNKEQRSEGEAKEELKPSRKAKSKKEKISLKDLSVLHNLRSRTLEPSFENVKESFTGLKVQKAFKEVVEAVRIGVNRSGDKEVQLDLKSNVLDGLKIKVSVHEGKVVTILEVTTVDVKNSLEAHLGELKDAFQQKGLSLTDVHIQFKEEPKQQQNSQQNQRDGRQGQKDEGSEQEW